MERSRKEEKSPMVGCVLRQQLGPQGQPFHLPQVLMGTAGGVGAALHRSCCLKTGKECGQFSHAHNFGAGSPTPPPTGSAVLGCLSEVHQVSVDQSFITVLESILGQHA